MRCRSAELVVLAWRHVDVQSVLPGGHFVARYVLIEKVAFDSSYLQLEIFFLQMFQPGGHVKIV